MKINLEPHYRNYWLDLARDEERAKEDAKKKEALAQLVKTINQVIAAKNKRRRP